MSVNILRLRLTRERHALEKNIPPAQKYDRRRQHELHPFRNALGYPSFNMKSGNQMAHCEEKQLAP